MKNRLTNIAENGFVYCTQCCVNEDKDCVEQDCFRAILDRLAAYEDTEYTPDELQMMIRAYNAMKAELVEHRKSGLSPEQVQELAQAKAEERLVVLPCKVGDIVWFTLNEHIDYGYVKWFETDKNGIWIVDVINPPKGPIFFEVNDFGKTVFLTREEAEKAIGGGRDGVD